MKRLFTSGACLAAVLAMGIAASAQNTGQAPPTPQAPATAPAQQESPAEEVTITGCVVREEDYRRAHNLGKGGAAGTGVGVENEFVLVNATKSPAAAVGTTGVPPTTPPTPPATPPAATPPAGGDAYEMTGSNESQLAQFVGKHVEISGKLKKADTKAAGATGGATEQVPGSRDLRLREVEVASVREVPGTCPAMPGK